MANQNHTPGPWHIDHDDRPGMKWNHHICGSNGRAVCLITHSETADANARLIAAAPELLEALQAIVDQEQSGDEETHMHDMADIARAAIAKATQQIVNEPSISEQRAMGIHFGIDE
jgi:hypothetical protein